MPTRRTPLERPRRSSIDAETVRLFIELEAVPMRQRRSRVFESRAYQLAKRLDLGSEHFCSRCSVLDRERQCCYSPEYLAHHAWHRVRAVREQLLAATGLSEPRRMRPS